MKQQLTFNRKDDPKWSQERQQIVERIKAFLRTGGSAEQAAELLSKVIRKGDL
jgi:hypothetical protein